MVFQLSRLRGLLGSALARSTLAASALRLCSPLTILLSGLGPSLVKKNDAQEFPLWLSVLRTQHCLCEGAGLTPGLAQQVKVTDAAQIQCHCGWGIGFGRSSDSTPSLGASIMLLVWP